VSFLLAPTCLTAEKLFIEIEVHPVSPLVGLTRFDLFPVESNVV
jgi:hypothetical protein